MFDRFLVFADTLGKTQLILSSESWCDRIANLDCEKNEFKGEAIPRFGFFPGFTDKDLKSTFRTIQQVFRYYLTSKNKITHVYAIFNSVSRLQIFYTFQRALKFHPLESPKIFLLFLVEPSLSFINIVVRTARQCQAYF